MELVDTIELFNKGEHINVTEDNQGGYVELWDFSEANISFENRVKAVSQVASVCYGQKGLKPNFKLYDKLARESIGLPSSSFEFVPVFLNKVKYYSLIGKYLVVAGEDATPNVTRYGFYIKDEGYITNLRALMYDLEVINQDSKTRGSLPPIDDEYWLNEKYELSLIRNNFKVFKIKATIRDFRQYERHRRASYQELSRRYTKGSRVPLEFRFSEKWGNVTDMVRHSEMCVDLYYKALESGMKPEDARDILPTSLYSVVWSAYYPDGLHNYLMLRTKSSAQKEIREIANAMDKLTLSLKKG
jgi:thymidylate synthase (FAD)